MKRILILLLIVLAVLPLLGRSFTGRPMMFAGSYMMRAHGSEANYWNPALLDFDRRDFWWPLLDTGVLMSNNTFDLDFYNRIMETGQITEADKDLLIKKMDGSLRLNMLTQASLLGFNLGGVALSSSLHLYNRAAFSENYLKLLLYGNAEEEYTFSDKHNNLASLSFADVTVGMGDFALPLPDKYPRVKFGWSASFLLGLHELKTTKFDGVFRSDFDGFYLNQDVVLRKGVGGFGFKGMVGFAGNVAENLEVGLTLDNILGNIQWVVGKEESHYQVVADSVYIADLENAYIVTKTEDIKIDPYSTRFPMELGLGALYDAKMVSLSADLKQGFGESPLTSKTPALSLGAEFKQLDFLPIRIGFSTGNSIAPWRVSYALGLRVKPVELSLGMQSIQSVFPGYKTKGLSFGLSFRTGI